MNIVVYYGAISSVRAFLINKQVLEMALLITKATVQVPSHISIVLIFG